MKHKLLAAATALLLLTGLCPNAFAAELEETAPEPEVIRIGSAEDFLTFAESCTLDSWSLGAQVQLLTDISLEDADFAPIPTFGGSFDGGGHTVSGLSVTQSMSPAGLFGTLQPTAVVKNLKVSGVAAPDGDGMNVGGIVGENYGTVEGCAFTGEVAGKTNVGGIAGANYGTVRNCTASGSITGSNRTGGIAGYHDGVIAVCRNEMAVNTESVDPTIDPSEIHLNFNLDFSQASNLDVSDAASDTGGIAGYSSGSITDCVNTGAVGYPHIGYNLGGIAGRSCGFVEKCVNKGEITGRKDVGGIVGQIEPHIQTVLSPDYLETLSQQFENLGGLVSRTGSHGAEMGGNVQASIESITGYQSSARAAVEALAAGAGSGEVDEAALSDLGSAVRGMVNASGGLKNAIGDGVDSLSSDISAISGQISSISRTFALATEDAKKETVTDLSDVDLDAITEGKVLSCTNRGRIEADLNVGGITGIMGLESTADPEDDAPSGSLTQRRRYELKDIVQDCENLGTVTGKRSYVGGICGRMELGLICDCRGYGSVSSENGDYVGGIAGLTGGTIRSCFAKCTLSGGSYIGGIVGSGIDEDYSGDASTVTGCCSVVEIPEYEAHIGAIAGVNTGVFTQNYFVSDTLAGINRVSYASVAEPVSYDALHEALPNPLNAFTLTFLADGELVKTLSFHYGDSFDSSVFPEIPQKEGCYAQWSREELQNLRFDTVVEAAYYPYITALPAGGERSAGRPVLFVQGQFKAGDTLQADPADTSFPQELGQVLEQWHLYIPADGLQTHSIRYLPSQEDVTLYLLKNGAWEKVDPQQMGSYLRFDAEEAEVEFAAVARQSFRSRWVLPSALAALAVLISLVWLGKKLKKRWWILAAALLLGAAIGAGCFLLPKTEVGQGIQAYGLVEECLKQSAARMNLTVKAQIENTDAGFTAEIDRTRAGDIPVSVISEGERKLYYADGVVFLENGTAYRLNSGAPDYWELMENVLEICRQAQIKVQDGSCSITVETEQATRILELLMPSAAELLPQANRLTLELTEENGQLSQMRFVGAGNLEDSVKTPYSLTAVVEILPLTEEVQFPEAVAKALSSGDYQAKELYSDDLVGLMEAWTQLRNANPVCADMVLEASCGEVTLNDAFVFYQWKVSGDRIRAVEKDGNLCYFTDSAACDRTGRKITAPQSLDAAKLVDIALDNLENTSFRCTREGEISKYVFTLNQKGMGQLVCALFPAAEKMDASFDRGSIQLTVSDGEIQSAAVTCHGSGKLLAAEQELQMQLDIRRLSDSPGPELPEEVREALLK
ncbi:MAG: GLUG motif-containing protein [Candidatus Faecousia sp.]|nr:GLUG motif-containing protein [Candidatus Faecousia sp.]